MIERLHGTIRDRSKVMRGLEDETTAQTIIDGFRTYYNFIRPHQALDGKTPAEIANINLNLKGNKWLELIRQSSKP
jgi:transposase InsO family protein